MVIALIYIRDDNKGNSMPNKSSAVSEIKGQFEVIRVSRITAPEGMDGKDWHSYIIKRGATEILGQKPGSKQNVTEHAKQIAADLNARSGFPSGSPYAARNRRV